MTPCCGAAWCTMYINWNNSLFQIFAFVWHLSFNCWISDRSWRMLEKIWNSRNRWSEKRISGLSKSGITETFQRRTSFYGHFFHHQSPFETANNSGIPTEISGRNSCRKDFLSNFASKFSFTQTTDLSRVGYDYARACISIFRSCCLDKINRIYLCV